MTGLGRAGMIARIHPRETRGFERRQDFPHPGIVSGLHRHRRRFRIIKHRLDLYAATFGVSLDALGTLLTAGMLGGLIAAFLSGALIGRFSIGPYLVGGIVFAGLGMLAYAAAPIWLLLLGAAFIASIGKGAIDTGLNNFFAANCSTSQMNWLHACWGIGLTLAPALVTWFVLDSAVGWRGSYIVTGVAILALGAAILLSLPRWQLGGSGAESPSSADPACPCVRPCAKAQ